MEKHHQIYNHYYLHSNNWLNLTRVMYLVTLIKRQSNRLISKRFGKCFRVNSRDLYANFKLRQGRCLAWLTMRERYILFGNYCFAWAHCLKCFMYKSVRAINTFVNTCSFPSNFILRKVFRITKTRVKILYNS